MKGRRHSPTPPAAPPALRVDKTNLGHRAGQRYFSAAETRETDTYSVFARFRKTRLPLARRVSLERALSFAETVRKERFRDPEDVFVVHDRSGETVATAPVANVIDAPAAIDSARDTAPASELEPARDTAPASELEPVRADSRADNLLERAKRCRADARRNLAQLNSSVKELRSLLHRARTTFAGVAEVYLEARTPRRD